MRVVYTQTPKQSRAEQPTLRRIQSKWALNSEYWLCIVNTRGFKKKRWKEWNPIQYRCLPRNRRIEHLSNENSKKKKKEDQDFLYIHLLHSFVAYCTTVEGFVTLFHKLGLVRPTHVFFDVGVFIDLLLRFEKFDFSGHNSIFKFSLINRLIFDFCSLKSDQQSWWPLFPAHQILTPCEVVCCAPGSNGVWERKRVSSR